jgi:hemoglobin
MRTIAWLGLAVVVAGCSSTKKSEKTAETTPPPAAAPAASAAPAPKSLYERLGGHAAITAVVDEFVARVAADKRINARFINTDIPHLKVLLVEFICSATGGPEKYEGRDMHTSHGGMQLVDEEFDALVGNLVGALKKFNVPDKEQGEILGALGPLKPQIVNPPPAEEAKHDPKLAEKAKGIAATLRKAGKTQDADLLDVAVTARTRGQRNYAEQLFSIVEHDTSAKELASVAALFRAGAPERITTPLKTMAKDTLPQPKSAVGSSDEDEPAKKPERGSLTGTVTLEGKPLGDRMAVVMLTPAAGKFAKRTPKHRAIEQRGRTFAPHIMAVPVGSTVAFPNFDPVFHNVFSVSAAKPFDLGIYKDGESREVTFDKEGFLRLGCNLHANMSAFLVVVGAPHYVVTDGTGKFKFHSLAPGSYKTKTFIEGISEPIAGTVDVKAGENTTAIAGKGTAQADLGTDKFGQPRGGTP